MQKLKRQPWARRLANTLQHWLRHVTRRLDPSRPFRDFLMTVAWIAILILAFSLLSGCAAQKTVRPLLPPQADPRVVPVFEGRTHRDVILYAVELREAALTCEADKAAIRKIMGRADATQ